jgi:hypothetical protein
MQLIWNLHPEHINVQQARSAAYQYRLQEWNDGRAELTVQHRGDRPSAEPIKRFPYKNRNAAFGGAQRFEDKHGYRDPAHHSPAEIVPFLQPFSERTQRFIEAAQQRAQGTAPIDADIETATMEYDELCTELLCCRIYDCYNRTEIDTHWCVEHSGRPTEDD